ncbi:hypothetical protein DER44DRAFT_194867 [Fusarium oxysporum]|nr:hypothetical protein DER44DRAFT_194867 [Fusarium oxysporum]
MVQLDNSLHSGLESLDQEIDSQETPQATRNATWRIHRSAVEGLYSAVETLEISGLMVCSWCFCNDSSELLTCGYGSCNACLTEIAISASEMDQRLKVVRSCDLHNPSCIRTATPVSPASSPDWPPYPLLGWRRWTCCHSNKYPEGYREPVRWRNSCSALFRSHRRFRHRLFARNWHRYRKLGRR